MNGPALSRLGAAEALARATIAMAQQQRPLMPRVLPPSAMRLWDRYPQGDIVSPSTGARAFYHAHPDGDDEDEHGHFHFFLPVSAMPADALCLRGPFERLPAADDVVHIAAMAFSTRGLPTALFTLNRWATDEWLYPAAAIMQALARFDLRDAPGDPLVTTWLTAAVHLCRDQIAALLAARDAALATGIGGEDRAHERLSQAPIDLQQLLGDAL